MAKLDAQQAALIGALDDQTERRLCAPYAPIRERLDADTVQAIERVQEVARAMKGADGIHRPMFIPSPVALAIVRALREENAPPEAEVVNHGKGQSQHPPGQVERQENRQGGQTRCDRQAGGEV
jgi:hypothetical protein